MNSITPVTNYYYSKLGALLYCVNIIYKLLYYFLSEWWAIVLLVNKTSMNPSPISREPRLYPQSLALATLLVRVR